jgi:Zn-dependent metalloprotease
MAKDDMATGLTGDKSPEDAAIAFFMPYAALFRMEDPRHELTLESIVTDTGGSRVRFAQHVNQVRVNARTIGVHLNAKGQITSISGSYVPNVLGMSTRPALDPTAAVTKAKVDLSTLAPSEALVMPLASSSPELFIYMDEGTPVLAYRLLLTDQGTAMGQRVVPLNRVSAEYWINAKSGKIMAMDGDTR